MRAMENWPAVYVILHTYFASMKVGSFSQILFIASFTFPSHGLFANGKDSAAVSPLLPHNRPILRCDRRNMARPC